MSSKITRLALAALAAFAVLGTLAANAMACGGGGCY